MAILDAIPLRVHFAEQYGKTVAVAAAAAAAAAAVIARTTNPRRKLKILSVPRTIALKFSFGAPYES